MATKKKAAPKKEFTISLTMGNDLYSGSGATPLEALNSLPHPGKIMTKGAITITTPSDTKTLAFTPVQIKRLFMYSQGVKPIIAKQLFTGLIKR